MAFPKGHKSGMTGKHHTEKSKQRMREKMKGHKPWNTGKSFQLNSGRTHFKKGSIPWNKNKKRPEISNINHWNWQGGISTENDKLRHSIEFRLWREAIFARDNWTCQKCKERGSKLHSHHIQNFAQFPELRTSIENGITFCKVCHKEFHKIYGYKNNKRQSEEFLRGGK